MIEMVFWFWGLYALLSGSLRMFGGLQFERLAARAVGLFFMVPLPISLYLPAYLTRLEIPVTDRRFFFIFFELLVLAFFVGIGLLVGVYLRARQSDEPIKKTEA